MDDNIQLNTQELADRWRLKPQTLINWRSQGTGPKFIRLGRRNHGRKPAVRYRMEDVVAYEQKHFAEVAVNTKG